MTAPGADLPAGSCPGCAALAARVAALTERLDALAHVVGELTLDGDRSLGSADASASDDIAARIAAQDAAANAEAAARGEALDGVPTSDG